MKGKDKPKFCPLCKGNMISGTTTYSVDLGFGVVMVRDVPALVCDQCGNDWIDSDVAGELQKITDEAKREKTQIKVVSLSDVKA